MGEAVKIVAAAVVPVFNEQNNGGAMKPYQFLVSVFLGIMVIGLGLTTASADSPPADKGNFESGSIQSATATLDPAPATAITRLAPAQSEEKIALTGAIPTDFLGQGISAASLQFIKFEDFEGAFPNDWQFFDSNGPTGGDQVWSDVPCLPRTGLWSAWPAGPDGLNGVNPCVGAEYPNDVSAWLIYGPFSLANAQTASFNFYLRMVTELCNPIEACDFLLWGASIDGEHFYGLEAAGTITGAYNNNYSFQSLDLTNVFTLGDLTGQPQVWVAFYFKSDASDTAAGAFIDDVSVVYEPATTITYTFLPVVIKSPPLVIPKTNLFVKNNTTGPASYTVKSPKFEGVSQPDLICNIAQGATAACGSFDSGTYQVRSSSPCGNGQGSRTFPAGDYHLNPPLHCID